jgi:hypothetical protein
MKQSIIPEVYPDNLEECLKIFEGIKYKSYGFPIVWLHYDYSFKHWSVFFRNPANFDNPDIQEDTPLKAVHKMFDFLKEIKSTKDQQSR